MNNQEPAPDYKQTTAYAGELDRIQQRRRALAPGSELGKQERPWGLALSGGGIRSATFALGVLQSLARSRPAGADPGGAGRPLLSRFDYLSTVSGGGYVGAFFSALFRPPQSRGPAGIRVNDPALALAQSEKAYKTLAVDPPGRITEHTPATEPDLPLRWLRENGRYMAPAGVGDLFYAACLQLRNWCAIQYVLGIMLLAVSLAGLVFRALSQTLPDPDFLGGFVRHAETSMQPAVQGEIWWSPWFWMALITLALATLPTGIAYWFTYRNQAGTPRLRAILTSPVTAAFLFMLCAASLTRGALNTGITLPVIFAIAWIAIALTVAIVIFYASGGNNGPLAEQRVRLTRWLAFSVRATLAIVLLGLVETVGQSAYLALSAFFADTSPAPTLTAMAAAVGGLLPVIKKLAALLTGGKPGAAPAGANRDLLLGLLAAALVFLLATVWYLLALSLYFGGDDPFCLPRADPDMPVITAPLSDAMGWIYVAALSGTVLIALFASGYFVGFLNLSSLATLYSARLTRAYLGASNMLRFTAGPKENTRDVAEPHAQDDFKPGPFHESTHYGPLHLINVTINSTTGPGDNLTQMDRKGLPMAITPLGISVNGALPRPFEAPAAGTRKTAGGGAQQQTAGAAPAAPSAGEELTIGQWVGVSGAAFSPGIGRGTTPALATLCTLANVRLGYWWNSRARREGTVARLSALVANQRYLLREMGGRFYGATRTVWYLTDGGHFENTAVYELLRRRCALVVACDDGADSQYEFEDLANLMRLARIDFGADFTPLQDHTADTFARTGLTLAPDAGKYLAERPEQLKKARDGGSECAIAYQVTYRDFPDEPTLLLVIKPRLTADAPLDLLQYQSTHPDFPQESTLDQFFDEAQWESYRKLGALSADRLFGR